MAKRIRIKDIAEKSGVSKGTVDRVIHNRGNVAPEVKARILKVMEELNYRPNMIASALAYNRNWRVATLTPDPEEDVFWQQPLRGIKMALNYVMDFGLSVDFFHFADADAQAFQRQCEAILHKNYDAVLVAPVFYTEAHQFLNQCNEQGLKYFLINTFLDRQDEYFKCYIGQDSFQSGILAAKLLNYGMENGDTAMVLHLEKGVHNSRHLVLKEQGFHHYFIEHAQRNIQVVKTSFENPANLSDLREFMNYQIKSYPNLKGIFVTTSKLYYLVDALPTAQLEKLKLVGFDLIEENLKHLNQQKIDFLINQNPVKQGYLGIVNIFNHLVRKKAVDAVQHLPLDVVILE
ncbi:MAG: substrate-binding domain-containing protein, partial [Bacteroidota bacterium]